MQAGLNSRARAIAIVTSIAFGLTASRASAQAPPSAALPPVEQPPPAAEPAPSEPPPATPAAATPPDGLPPSIPTAPTAAGSPTAPFGPGATVHVTSGGGPVTVFVARVPVGAAQPPLDSDFVKVGKTPIEFQLPPGSYQIEAQGHDISHEKLLLEMHSEPRHLLVRPGSEGLGVVGSLCLGVGVTAVLAATVILLSGGAAPEKLDKPAIAIPLYIVGGVLLGAGIGFSIASDTDIEDQKTPPAKRVGNLRPLGKSFGLSVGLSF